MDGRERSGTSYRLPPAPRPAHHHLAARPQHLQRHGRGLPGALPSAPVQRLHRAVVLQLRGGDRPSRGYLLQHGLEHLGGQPLQAGGQVPPWRLPRALAVVREGVRRENAALLGPVLEGMARHQVPVHVPPCQPVQPGQRHQIRVGADDVERIQLNAAQGVQQRAGALGARGEAGPGQGVVADEPGARHVGVQRSSGGQGGARHARAHLMPRHSPQEPRPAVIGPRVHHRGTQTRRLQHGAAREFTLTLSLSPMERSNTPSQLGWTAPCRVPPRNNQKTRRLSVFN